MYLSNKLTFYLVFSVLLAVGMIFAPTVMAQTIAATWTDDLNDDNTADDPGWDVTIGGLADTNDPDVTYLDPAGTTAAAQGTQTGFDAATATVLMSEGTIAAGIGDVIAVQVVIAANTYQRVTFPAGGPGATLASTTLTLLPKLAELAVSEYYVSFNGTVTVTFNFAAAVADTNGAPVAPLHVSDVTVDGTNSAGLQIVSVSGTNRVTFRSTLGVSGTSGSSTVDLSASYATQATVAADGQAMVTFDDTAPTITNNAITVAAPAGFPTPSDGVWNSTFLLTFSVGDEDGGSGLPDVNPVSIETDNDKLEVEAIGLGTADNTETDTEYLVRITPKAGRDTTAGENVTITIVPVDKAGNEGSGVVSVKLAASQSPAAAFTRASPASGNVGPGGTITVTFDKDPGTVNATNATVTGTGNTRTVTVGSTAGAQEIVLTWDKGGRQVLNYTVVIPPDAAVAFTSAAPASGNVMRGTEITLTFAADPGTVTASVGAISGTGTTRTLTIPAAQAAGAVTITVSWTKTGHQAGSQMLTYTVIVPPADNNPTSPSNIMKLEIPAESYVVLVRSMSETEGALEFPQVPPVNGTDVNVEVWGDMPDLHDLFLRSAQNHGGALVVRRSVNAHENDMTDEDGNLVGRLATPARGSVGISEIMWARDLRQGTADEQAAGQWIELQNLNSKPVVVLIYAQKGGDGLISGGILVNTAAGDNLLGNLDHSGTMVVDAIQNIRNDGNQANNGWDVVGKGQDGNSVEGVPFASMHRILPDKQPAFSASQNYTKRKGTKDSHWATSIGAYVRGQTTHTSGGISNIPVLFDYRGTPGDVNNRTGITLHTKAGRTNLSDSLAVVFNEIGNRSTADKAYEWIELRNRTGSAVDLRAYIITTITGVNAESILYRFPNETTNIAANGVLLLLASNPADDNDHPIAIGYDIDKAVEDQVPGFKGDHVPRYKVVSFGSNGIPNGNFVLVLRRPDNAGKNDISETGRNDFDKIVDMAGYANLSANPYPNPVSSTGLWPLDNFPGPVSGNNLTENKVHRRSVDKDNKDGDRFGTGRIENNNGRPVFVDAGFTGIGYRRDVANAAIHGGDPGYHNPQKNLAADFTGDVVISELMLSIGSSASRRLPQWIEIANNSATKTVNLDADNGWELVIETPGDEIRTLNFKAKGQVKYIYPKQTILIVAGSPTRNAQAGSDNLRSDIIFKSDRVFNVIREYGDKFSEFEVDGARVKNDRYRFLNPIHFHIALKDGKGNTADVIGNLDGRARTNDTAAWDYPSGLTKEGDRTSFVRLYDEGNARSALGAAAVDVLTLGAVGSGAVDQGSIDLNDFDSVVPSQYAWIQAAAFNFDTIYVRHTWYGSEDDYGTPGAIKGQVLPVQLSSFRPALENGKIVVRWTTESELDNAGFNVYRSESRDGEYKQVNAEMIQGAGTTGERNAYDWVDASAKPGQVYYYQIEDVSFAGERQMLATTKLRGLISAENKLTTKWGEIKKVQ